MGPQTEPWGTPNVTSTGDERTPLGILVVTELHLEFCKLDYNKRLRIN